MNDELEMALERLRAGCVIAAATESFFGLLVDIANPLALEALFALKPRGADKCVPVLLPNRAAWAALVRDEIPSLAQRFADAGWPGALSIALPAAPSVAARVALDGSLAVRLPGDSAAAELSRCLDRPLSATSANLPGAAPVRSSDEVRASFAEPIAQGALFVVSGESPGGAPSTVVAVSEANYAVVRVGRVPVSVLDAIAQAHAHNA